MNAYLDEAIRCPGMDAGGPYEARDLGGAHGWWGVFDRNDFNVLRFLHKPGAVVADEELARRVATKWNAE